MPKLKPVKTIELIKVLTKLGFEIVRRKGSHVSLKRGNTVITVPYHTKPLGIGLIRRIIKDANITKDEFIRLLKD